MTNISVIENRISLAKKYIKILARYRKYSQKEIEADIDIHGAAERYLFLAVQATIDVAESVVAYKKLRKPTTMSEAFHILNEEDIISKKLAEKMINMTGFRNIIVHGYDKIDYGIVFDIIQEDYRDMLEFLKKVESVLTK